MKCQYCEEEYVNKTYDNFCTRTCTNKHNETFERDGYTVIPYKKFDIAKNELGFFIFSKKDDRPKIGSFETEIQAVTFARERVA